MKFLYPYFLFALLAVSIPLVIHFFNFKRYKTVYFSNVNFLKAVKKESRKKSQLKQILILISRILFITFLVFAFSQPYIPFDERGVQRARQAVAIYIDNSFSMRLEGEKGILLEQARNKAIEIAASYRPGTKFLLLTNDFKPQHRYLLDKEQLIVQLGGIKVSPNTVKFGKILAFAKQQLNKTGKKYDKTLYALSDFQKNNFDFGTLECDTTLRTNLLPFTSGKINNLYIDSCWFEVPGRKINQAEKLFVHVINSSNEGYQNIPLRLEINDSLKAISNLNIGAGEEQIVEMDFTNNSSGFQYGLVELDDYPLVYDNSYSIAYQVKSKVDVLGIFEEGDPSMNYFKALFSDDEFVNYEAATINNLQISRIKNKQCVFLVNLKNVSSGLGEELFNFVDNAGTLAIFPSGEAEINSYNQFLTKLNTVAIAGSDTGAIKISEINYNDILFKDVFKKKEEEADLPTVRNSFSFAQRNNIARKVLMTFRNGQAVLTSLPAGNGQLYLFAFPASLKNTSFLKHIIFVPSVYNIAMNSISGQPISYPIEIQNKLLINRSELESGSAPVVFRKRDSNNEYLPAVTPIGGRMLQLNLGDFVQTAGHYQLLSESKTIEALAFNYKRDESKPEFFSSEELQTIIKRKGLKQFQVIEDTEGNFVETLQDLNSGKQLWQYFLILALLAVFCESLIIRLWK